MSPPLPLPTLFSSSNHPKGKGCDYNDEWEPNEKDGEIIECGDEPLISSSSLPQIKYTILNKAEVLKLLEDEVTRVSTVLSLSKSEAATLLHHFKWSIVKAEEEWLTCEEKIRKTVGLLEKPVVITTATEKIACWICHEKFPGNMMLGVSCGHQFCRSCLTGYISKAIHDGPGCLALRCPGPSCYSSVGLDLIELLSSEEDKKKYEDYLIRSFLTCNKQAKCCPAQDCEFAVLLNPGGDCSSTVTCQCAYKFCWNCTKEAHTPVDCDTAEKWISETNKQSENWLLTDTKPCPTCARPIQLDQVLNYSGCNSPSRYQFCGIPFGKQSRAVAGDYWYRKCRCGGSLRFTEYIKEDEFERCVAKISLRRYQHFYEGWIINESSRANAITDLKLFQQVHIKMICHIFCLNEPDLDFLVDAQLQIAECYQLLKWTYVYGYYMPENESTKLRLFEFMQAQAKDLVVQLQKQVQVIESFLNEDVHLQQFIDFREKLLTLTSAARNYMNKMVEALTAGLSEVVSVSRPNLSPKTVAKDVDVGREMGQPKPKSKPEAKPKSKNHKSYLSWFLARFINARFENTSPNLKARPKDR